MPFAPCSPAGSGHSGRGPAAVDHTHQCIQATARRPAGSHAASQLGGRSAPTGSADSANLSAPPAASMPAKPTPHCTPLHPIAPHCTPLRRCVQCPGTHGPKGQQATRHRPSHAAPHALPSASGQSNGHRRPVRCSCGSSPSRRACLGGKPRPWRVAHGLLQCHSHRAALLGVLGM